MNTSDIILLVCGIVIVGILITFLILYAMRNKNPDAKEKRKHKKPKKSTIVIASLCVAIAGLIGYMAYYIIAVNITVDTLRQRVVDRDNEIAAYVEATPTPEPTENDHLVEMAELKTLYSQKAAILDNYTFKADEIRKLYSKDKQFQQMYGYAIESEHVMRQIEDSMDEIVDDYGYSSASVRAAVNAAKYTLYVQEKEQKLIKARGYIDTLNIKFSSAVYRDAKKELDAIKDTLFMHRG